MKENTDLYPSFGNTSLLGIINQIKYSTISIEEEFLLKIFLPVSCSFVSRCTGI